MKARFLAVLTVVISTSLCGCQTEISGPRPVVADSVYSAQSLFSQVQQQTSERVYNTDRLRPGQLVVHEDKQPIYPVSLRASNGIIYLLDHGDVGVWTYDLSGNRLGKIGRGVGNGPGELIIPSDLYVGRDTLWLSSIKAGLVYRFLTTGEFVDQFQLPGAYKITKTGNAIVVLTFGSEYLFRRLTGRSSSPDRFGEILENQLTQFLSLNGWLSATPRGFRYVPSYAGYIFEFDHNGRPIAKVTTVDPRPFPEATATVSADGGLSTKVDKPKVLVVGTAQDRSKFFIHSGFTDANTGERKSVVDVYTNDGTVYEMSVRLPFPVRAFDVSDGVLYLASASTGLSAFRLPESVYRDTVAC